MSNVVRTSIPEPAQYEPVIPTPKDDTGVEQDFTDIEPIELKGDSELVIEALGLDESLDNVPEEDQSNIKEVSTYVKDIIKKRGIEPTSASFKRVLDDLKSEMGLDADASPEIILDRVGGVVKAWKEISFIKNPEEKRRLFMKLARQPSSKEMNRLVFEEMERSQIWQ